MRIIGFTGYKGSGKSEAAKALHANAIQVNFADALKEMFKDLTTFNALYGPSEVRNSTCIRGTQVTVRSALQTVGVAMRDLDPDFWVKLWKMRIADIASKYPLNPIIYKYWTVTDVRFPNEAEAIRDMGGCIIRLSRGINHYDNHISELPLPEHLIDITIANSNTIKHLHNEVRKIAEQ